jgi:hypothetical protein
VNSASAVWNRAKSSRQNLVTAQNMPPISATATARESKTPWMKARELW